MTRLERQGALDIGDRALKFTNQVIEGGALVPAFGKIGAHFDDGVKTG